MGRKRMTIQATIQIDNIDFSYLINGEKIFKSFSYQFNEFKSYGIIGVSGSGKSTLARLMIGLGHPQKGQVSFNDTSYKLFTNKEWGKFYQDVQLITQRPFESFDPRQTFRAAFIELARNNSIEQNKFKEQMSFYCENFGLPLSLLNHRPGEVSGGQCQKMSIIRALLLEPKILICDEITSDLDAVSQYEIMKQMKSLRADKDIMIIIISHNLPLINHMCDEVLVLD